MATFIGTLLLVSLCCLLMGLGAIAGRGPLAGGCGMKRPGKCEGCPRPAKACERHGAKEGEES